MINKLYDANGNLLEGSTTIAAIFIKFLLV